MRYSGVFAAICLSIVFLAAAPSTTLNVTVQPSPTPASYYTPSASPVPKLALNPNPFAAKVCASDPCSPVIDANSATYNASFFGSSVQYLAQLGLPDPSDPSSLAFDSLPVYSSSGSDPSYTIDCATGGNCTNYNYSNTSQLTNVHLPNGAKADYSYTDYLLEVIDASNPGIETDTEEFNTGSASSLTGTENPVTGGSPNPVYARAFGQATTTCFTATVNNCFGGSAAGTPETVDIVDPVELLNQSLPHTLHLVPNCVSSNQVANYPSETYGGSYNGSGSGPNTCPPFGEMLWLDKTDAQIEAMSEQRWVKTFYHNLHDYGWIILDNGSCNSTCTGSSNSYLLQIASDFSWTAVGQPSQWQVMENEMTAEGTTLAHYGASPTWNYLTNIPVDSSITVSNLHWLKYTGNH